MAKSTPFLLAILIFNFLLSSSAWAFASKPLPLMMGTMGDSISAGTLADLKIPKDDEREYSPEFIIENKATLSWSSGRRIRSHLMRLRDYLHQAGEVRELRMENVAQPGNQSVDLKRQAEKLLAAAQSGKYSGVEYITLLIGANDVCSKSTPRGVPLDQVRENIMKAFAVLSQIKQDEKIRILLVGIPRIPELGVPAIQNSHTVFGLTCHTLRTEILHFCTPLLTWANDQEFDEKMSIIEDMNRLLRTIASEASLEFPNLDVAYSDRLSHRVVPRDYLAIDCFHPNAEGQETLADETWLDQPWFGSVGPKWECRGIQIHQSGPKLARNGEQITYQISLSNEGGCDLGPAKMTDFIPRRSYYESAMPEPSTTTLTPVAQILWDPIRLSPNEIQVYRVTVRVSGPVGRIVTNTACFENARAGRVCTGFDTLITASQ